MPFFTTIKTVSQLICLFLTVFMIMVSRSALITKSSTFVGGTISQHVLSRAAFKAFFLISFLFFSSKYDLFFLFNFFLYSFFFIFFDFFHFNIRIYNIIFRIFQCLFKLCNLMINSFTFSFILFDLLCQYRLLQFLYFTFNFIQMQMNSLLHHFYIFIINFKVQKYKVYQNLKFNIKASEIFFIINIQTKQLKLQIKILQFDIKVCRFKYNKMGIGKLGIFRFAKNCCGQQSDQQTIAETACVITSASNLIQQDYKRFQGQTWFRFRKNLCFDPKKFIFLYSNYDEQQTKLIKHWRNIDMKNAEFGRIGDPDGVKSYRWKYAIRRGVPIIYYKAIISVIFNRNFEILNVKSVYQKILIQNKIDTHKHKNPPMLGLKQTNIKQAVFAPFFNHEGYKALTNILFLLQKTKGGRLTYNPYLVHIIALFLIFFEQQETYDVVSIMIDNSTNNNDRRMESLRWHCVFKQQQLETVAESFYVFIGSKSGTVKKLSKHFDSMKIDKIKIFKTIFQNFFYGVLPFKIILRVFILFLNEGVKFILRLFYSLFKGCQAMLKVCQTTDKCLIVIRKRWIACEDQAYQQLLKSSYNIVLEKYVNMKIEESFCQNKQKIVYYIPFIKNQSQILTFDDLQTLWAYLPQQLQHYDVEKVYPLLCYEPKNTQRMFQDIIEQLQISDLCFVVIKTTNDQVFGAFFARGLVKQRQSYVGHSQNFVFQLHPTKNKYSSTGQNVFYLINKKDCLEVGGGGDGPAIRLKQNLQVGQSFRSDTYKNQNLHSGRSHQFKIKKIQLFVLY